MSASSDQKQNKVYSISVQLKKKDLFFQHAHSIFYTYSLSIYLPSKTLKMLQNSISEIKINQR